MTEQPSANYYFGYGVGPSNAPALEAVKTWVADGERRFDTFTIAEYGMYEDAAQEEKDLTEVQTLWGVQSAMNLAEKMAVASGYLDPERADGRVFFQNDAPPDPFSTVRERELAAPAIEASELPPFWAVEDGGPVPVPPLEKTDPQAWRLDQRAVVDPNNEPLGQALFCTLLPDADMPDFDTPLAVRTLEMAHFESGTAAERFAGEFSGYLVPGMLDGPELAAEVAKLEGLSGEWIEREQREWNRDDPLVRERADWHPHQPDAERKVVPEVNISDWETEPDFDR